MRPRVRATPRRSLETSLSPGKRVLWVWGFFLSLWGIFISGMFSDLTRSPGIIQSVGLRSLLRARTQELSTLEEQIARLEQERGRLEDNSVAQEQEIRRVLGYTAPDEIVFDFSSADSPH